MLRQWIRPALLPYLYASLIIVVFGWVYAAIFDKDLEVMGDNATYYILGKALFQGAGYTHINAPEAPPANGLPPGYPALIALTMALWSSDFVAIKLVNGIFLLLSVLTLFALARTLSGSVHLAFVVSLAALFNGHLLRWSTLMMSEISFLFFSLAALLVYTRLGEENFKRPQIYFLLLCLVAVFYIRTMGVALMLAICVMLAWHRQWRYLAFLVVGCSAAVLPWSIRGQRLGGNPYIDQLLSVNPYQPELGGVGLGDLVERVFHNAKRYIFREIPDGLLCHVERDWSTGSVPSDWLLGVLLIALSTYGLYKLPKHRRLLAVYMGGTGGILLLWPQVWMGTRFLLPLIPILLLGVLNAVYALGLLVVNKVRSAVPPASPLALLPVLLIYAPDVSYMHLLVSQGAFASAWTNYFDLARWTAANTAPDAIVACRKPSLFYLYSNRKTVVYKFTPDIEELLDDLRQRQVDYVVAENLGYSTTPRYLVPAISQRAEQFAAIYKLDDPATWLLEFKPPDG